MGGRLRGYSRLIVVGTGATLDLSKERNCQWISQKGPGYSFAVAASMFASTM